MKNRNAIKDLRESLMISKSELSRKSGLSIPTINRVESGLPCRENTKRKLLQAMGYNPADGGSILQFKNDIVEH